MACSDTTGASGRSLQRAQYLRETVGGLPRYHPFVRVRVLDLRSKLITVGVATEALEARGVLELQGAPEAFLTELQALGYAVSREGGLVRAAKGLVPPLVDLTGLEAPEPMQRILLAFSQLQPGEVFLALLPHRPVPLFPHLEARKASYEVALRPDGTAVLWLSR